MEPINVAQAIADLLAMMSLVFIVPNLFWFNKKGIVTAIVAAVLCHYNPGNAIYFFFLGAVVSGCFYLKARAAEFSS